MTPERLAEIREECRGFVEGTAEELLAEVDRLRAALVAKLEEFGSCDRCGARWDSSDGHTKIACRAALVAKCGHVTTCEGETHACTLDRGHAHGHSDGNLIWDHERPAALVKVDHGPKLSPMHLRQAQLARDMFEPLYSLSEIWDVFEGGNWDTGDWTEFHAALVKGTP